MWTRTAKTVLGLLTLALLEGLLPAVADPDKHRDWEEQDSSYYLARQAVERGEAIPLHKAMESLHHIAPGNIVSTEYEFEFDRWVYEFKIIDPRGQLKKIHLDARNGELVLISDY